MKNSQFKLLLIALTFVVLSVSLVNLGSATTTCAKPNCGATITIHIAFADADSATMEKWKSDIESVWGNLTYGEGNCKLEVKVDATTVTSCSNVSDKHCITVTSDYVKDKSGRKLRGFLYGIPAAGSSVKGKWSSHMNEILPGITGSVHDAAHQAGHLMGLSDDYNGASIMGKTWSDVAKPTKAQVDSIVSKNCGVVACPANCLCGNSKKDTGEQCDYSIKPSGCATGDLCVSCKCVSITPAVCGDGKVSSTEECDYFSSTSTCNNASTNNTMECSKQCKCVVKTNTTEEPENETLSIEITDPDNNDEIDAEITVKVDVTGSNIEYVKFYMNNTVEFTDETSPYRWTLDPADFDEGKWTLKAKVYDHNDSYEQDSITIYIVAP